MKLETAHLCLPKSGETECGDAVVVREQTDGILVGVIDGLGHGPVAAAAAKLACDYLDAVDLSRSMPELIDGLNQVLKSSRGIAATLTLIREKVLVGCSVGNVLLQSHGVRVSVLISPGILGGHIAKLRTYETALTGPIRLLFCSDGVSREVVVDDTRHLTPEQACDKIMQRFRRDDDATVLVVDLS